MIKSDEMVVLFDTVAESRRAEKALEDAGSPIRRSTPSIATRSSSWAAAPNSARPSGGRCSVASCSSTRARSSTRRSRAAARS